MKLRIGILKQDFSVILLALITLVLAGCGFHLRGTVDIPRWLNNVAIIVHQGNRELEPRLKEQLLAYNVQVAAEPNLATYWLIIENDSFQQNISSISSSTTPRQYELVYTVRFKLQRAKGSDLIPSSQVVISRHITLNSDRILGSTGEEDIQKREMIRDASLQILYRLSRNAQDVIPKTTQNH